MRTISIILCLLLATSAFAAADKGLAAMESQATDANADLLQDTEDKPAADPKAPAAGDKPVDSKATKEKAVKVDPATLKTESKPKKLLKIAGLDKPKVTANKDSNTKEATTKPKDQKDAKDTKETAKTDAKPATVPEKTVEEPNLNSEKEKLKNLTGELDVLTARLQKVEAKDLEIRKQKVADQSSFDSIHQEAFNRIHKEMFGIMNDANSIREMADHIIKAKERIEDILRSPWKPRPMNGSKPVGKKHVIKTKKVDPKIAEIVKETPSKKNVEPKSELVKKKTEKKIKVKAPETVVGVKQADEKKVKAGSNVMVDALAGNKTENKAPVTEGSKKVAVKAEKEPEVKIDKNAQKVLDAKAMMNEMKGKVDADKLKKKAKVTGKKNEDSKKAPEQKMVAGAAPQPAEAAKAKVVSLAQAKAMSKSKNKNSSESYDEVLAEMRDEELFGKAAAEIAEFQENKAGLYE